MKRPERLQSLLLDSILLVRSLRLMIGFVVLLLLVSKVRSLNKER